MGGAGLMRVWLRVFLHLGCEVAWTMASQPWNYADGIHSATSSHSSIGVIDRSPYVSARRSVGFLVGDGE